jgi:hypothetical protein
MSRWPAGMRIGIAFAADTAIAFRPATDAADPI